MKRAILFLALLAPVASAKPITIHLDEEVRKASAVFEATLVAHHPEGSSCRLEVTSDVRRIFRGFESAGKTLEVAWPANGGASFQSEVSPGSRLLYVIGEGGQVVVTGTREGDGWRAQGYYDFNAVLVRIDGRDADFDELQHPYVEDAWLAEKTGSDPRRHAYEVGRWLFAPTAGEDHRTRFAAAVAGLDSESWEERERAAAALDGPLGVEFLSAMENLSKSSTSAEVRSRLSRILGSLGRWRAARDLARGLSDPGPDRWRVLAVCLEAPEPDLARASLEALRRETGREDLPADPAAWLEFVESAGR